MHTPGITHNKTEHIEMIRNGKLDYRSIATDNVKRDGRWQMLDFRTSPIPKSQESAAAAQPGNGRP